MALTGTDRGTGTHNTSATSFTGAPASNLTAGAMAVMVIASDNNGTLGALMATFTVTDTKSNTWTRRQSPLNDPGAANQGVEGAIFTTPQNGGALTTSDTLTVTFSDSPTAKTWTLMEVTAGAGNSVEYVTGNIGTSGTLSTSPTITTGTITDTNMVIGALFLESGTATTITADGDTTNGNWSTQQESKIGSGAAGVCAASQRKVVTATATQTYNPTLSVSPDLALAWIELREKVNTTVTPDLVALVTTTFAPTVTASDHKTATPTTLALTTATFAPVVSTPVLATPTTVALVTATFAPTVSVESGAITATPTTVALVLTTLAPTVTLSDNAYVEPTTAALVLTTFAPDVEAIAPQLVTPGVAALVLTTYAPVVFEAGPVDRIDGELVVTARARGRLVVSTPYIKGEF